VNTLDECKHVCDSSLQEVRTLSYLLHPPTFNQSGLAGALETFVEGFSRRSGIPVELRIADSVDPLLPVVERDLFRVVQEGLANVARHSGSDRAIVSMEVSADWVSVKVQDFGKGMPAAFAEGVGLASMRERLRHLGGQLEIQSGADGTSLKASVPRRIEKTGELASPRPNSASA
jgi:signal transduction histidine kinase